ncbi:MAG: hypothetical protein P4L43_02115 [Syntrophobacteraceae bacterium]|nr:hypothetical protein [Syntrophobacteraceae bacterium]
MNERKGKTEPMRRSTRHKPTCDFYTPFKELDQLFGPTFSTRRTHLDEPPEKTEVYLIDIKGETYDHLLFKRAMADVNPLLADAGEKVALRLARKSPRFLVEEEARAYAQRIPRTGSRC